MAELETGRQDAGVHRVRDGLLDPGRPECRPQGGRVRRVAGGGDEERPPCGGPEPTQAREERPLDSGSDRGRILERRATEPLLRVERFGELDQRQRVAPGEPDEPVDRRRREARRAF